MTKGHGGARLGRPRARGGVSGVCPTLSRPLRAQENDKKLPNIHAGVPAAALLSPAPTVSAPASREGSAPSAPSSPSKAGGDSVAPLAGAPPVPLQRPPLVPLLPSNGEAGPSNGAAGGWPEHMAPRGVYSGGYSPVRLLAEASSSNADGISAVHPPPPPPAPSSSPSPSTHAAC